MLLYKAVINLALPGFLTTINNLEQYNKYTKVYYAIPYVNMFSYYKINIHT